MLTYQIRVTLRGTKPPIWRRLTVPADLPLGDLHLVLQIVMDWDDEHLHQFILRDNRPRPTFEEIRRAYAEGEPDEDFFNRMQGARYFGPTTDPMGGPLNVDWQDEYTVRLAEVCPKVKSKLTYEYDFGDSWEHIIEVQKIFESDQDSDRPKCLAGKKASPIEDCGGLWGYYGMLEALADPEHEEHEDVLDRLGKEFDPETFDIDAVNAELAECWKG